MDGWVDTLLEPDPDRFEERFNDVVANPAGRVFAGTMPDLDAGVPSRLYRLRHDGTFEEIRECVLPNGIGFTEDLSQFYFTDSAQGNPDVPGRIYRYDYDEETGAVSDPVVFVDSTVLDGFLDGMTVDREDHVWSAFWGGNHVYRFRPDGSSAAAVPFPARKVSAVTFGGPEYGHVYATMACEETRETEGDGAGALYRFEPEVDGRPAFRSRIDQ